jgi:hypothetical protein
MLRRCAVFLACFIIFCSCNGCTVAGKSQLPRGASPSDAALYSAAEKSGEFECKDGSSKIPYSRVNDDYCDCADGSDEPGACGCHLCWTQLFNWSGSVGFIKIGALTCCMYICRYKCMLIWNFLLSK